VWIQGRGDGRAERHDEADEVLVGGEEAGHFGRCGLCCGCGGRRGGGGEGERFTRGGVGGHAGGREVSDFEDVGE
jgi:hypothetical protein